MPRLPATDQGRAPLLTRWRETSRADTRSAGEPLRPRTPSKLTARRHGPDEYLTYDNTDRAHTARHAGGRGFADIVYGARIDGGSAMTCRAYSEVAHARPPWPVVARRSPVCHGDLAGYCARGPDWSTDVPCALLGKQCT
jgi:hypothetical protein